MKESKRPSLTRKALAEHLLEPGSAPRFTAPYLIARFLSKVSGQGRSRIPAHWRQAHRKADTARPPIISERLFGAQAVAMSSRKSVSRMIRMGKPLAINSSTFRFSSSCRGQPVASRPRHQQRAALSLWSRPVPPHTQRRRLGLLPRAEISRVRR